MQCLCIDTSLTVIPLSKIEIFHIDRGKEFKNKLIDEVVNIFEIERSLNNKDYLYDNSSFERFNNVYP